MPPDVSTVEPPPKPKGKWKGPPGYGKERLAAPWRDIQDAVASGIAMSKVAKQFAEHHPKGWEAMHDLIRKRAQRENWLVPATQIANAQARLQERGIDVTTMSQGVVPAPPDPEKTGTFIAQTLAEMGEEGSVIAGKLSLDLLKKAASNPKQIAPIVDSKDIATSIKTLRLVAGMDRQGPVVALNLWSDAPMSRVVPGTSHVVPDVETWSDGD